MEGSPPGLKRASGSSIVQFIRLRLLKVIGGPIGSSRVPKSGPARTSAAGAAEEEKQIAFGGCRAECADPSRQSPSVRRTTERPFIAKSCRRESARVEDPRRLDTGPRWSDTVEWGEEVVKSVLESRTDGGAISAEDPADGIPRRERPCRAGWGAKGGHRKLRTHRAAPAGPRAAPPQGSPRAAPAARRPGPKQSPPRPLPAHPNLRRDRDDILVEVHQKRHGCPFARRRADRSPCRIRDEAGLAVVDDAMEGVREPISMSWPAILVNPGAARPYRRGRRGSPDPGVSGLLDPPVPVDGLQMLAPTFAPIDPCRVQ